MAASDPAALYLELLKECLLGRVYGPEHTVADDTYEFGRNFGAAFPERAATMIGRVRLNNLHGCVERAIQDGVPGDLIETGVWRGGVPILMRAIVKARGEDRLVWVADSFAGLPDPDLAAYPLDREFIGHAKFDVGIDDVRAQFERYGLLDDGVRFLEGWFKDTLPTVAGREFAVARLDGDMYGSTIEALTELYPRLSTGGFLIVDDYHAYHACAQAVTDYRDAHGITEPIEPIDWTGVYWRKAS